MIIVTTVKYRVKKNEEYADKDCEIKEVIEGSDKFLLIEVGEQSIKISREDFRKVTRLV